MAFDQHPQNHPGMVEIRDSLSRYVILAAALIYGFSLSWGTTLNSLPLAAKIAGWEWMPVVSDPLLWLFTLPIRCLPAGWIPVGLNLFFAICGALTLGLLARSINLLRWDYPPEGKIGWLKYFPALLACAICGLEFNFWREATAASGAMLNQLLLAAGIWCLMEYRASKQSRWLNAAAVIWGLGLAENWVMLLNLPLFVAALIGLRRKRFFKRTFLLRMALLGLAGFSIYALPLLINAVHFNSLWSSGEILRAILKTSRNAVRAIEIEFWERHRLMLAAVLLYFLAPPLPLLVRLRDRGMKNIPFAERFQIRIYRGLCAGLLLACLWLAFDPGVGLRQILARQTGISLPLLSFDYLNALAVGFLAGNFLFVSQIRPTRRLRGMARKINSQLRHAMPAIVATASGLVVFALLAKNAPAIFLTNRQPLESFGRLVVDSLPAGGGLLLGDDASKLVVVQAALARRSEGRHWQVADIRSLPSPEYRAALERRQALGWLTAQNQHALQPLETLRLLNHVARTRRIFYLQPSPGNFLFEEFSPDAHAAVAELKFYDEGQMGSPTLTPAAVVVSEKFWDDAWRQKMEPLLPPRSSCPSLGKRISNSIFRMFSLESVPAGQNLLLGSWYAAFLDGWGVELQRSGRLTEARHRFEQALALNSNNWSAAINLQCNTNLQAGNPISFAKLNELAGQFKNLQTLVLAMKNFGPLDDPELCFLLGNVCQQTGWPRQAAQQLERAKALAPDVLVPALSLAEFYSRYRMDDKVLEIVKHLRSENSVFSPQQLAEVDVELSVLEARAWMSQTNPANARRVLQLVLQQHPNDSLTANRVCKEFLAAGDLTNAMQLVRRQLAGDPDNVPALNLQAAIFISMDQSATAVPVLQRALAITNSPAIRLNLALAYLQSGNLPAAETEYRQLENQPMHVFGVHQGLAEIAEQRHDTTLAIQQLEICLSNAPPGTLVWEETRSRLEVLKNPVQLEPGGK